MTNFPSSAEHEVDESTFEKYATELLAGKVFHATAAHLLPAIVASSNLLPNRDGRLKSPFSQSSNSYGVKRGYVCLFDFRDASAELISSAFYRFLSGAIRKYAYRPTFLIVGDSLHAQLIPWQTAYSEIGYREVYMDGVECWYPSSIPIQAITSAEVMRVRKRRFDGSLAAWHARKLEAKWRKIRREDRNPK